MFCMLNKLVLCVDRKWIVCNVFCVYDMWFDDLCVILMCLLILVNSMV